MTDASNTEWKDTLKRLGVDEVDIMRVTDDDILYLAKRWQFLQLIENSGAQKPLDEPQFLESRSGWTIYYYGDAMCTSPGRFLLGGGNFRWSDDDDGGSGGDGGGDGGGGGGVNPGKGTIIKQAFDAACDMILLAKQFGWKGVMIIDGHPDMQRAAWVEGVRSGVRVDGYRADQKAEEKRRRIVSPSVSRMKEVIQMLKSGA